ncbi:hypothetical protein NDU88_000255 [Pleurodeles waltl]|uniref:Uncharacterized protein n=1 Tax=Pleurodeles waltl TaxID=8319 RepID=A0AAV7WEX8_PLEWA|nr:hypothetical protein NDU88_000255 [Pleurodeles waltl]
MGWQWPGVGDGGDPGQEKEGGGPGHGTTEAWGRRRRETGEWDSGGLGSEQGPGEWENRGSPHGRGWPWEAGAWGMGDWGPRQGQQGIRHGMVGAWVATRVMGRRGPGAADSGGKGRQGLRPWDSWRLGHRKAGAGDGRGSGHGTAGPRAMGQLGLGPWDSWASGHGTAGARAMGQLGLGPWDSWGSGHGTAGAQTMG